MRKNHKFIVFFVPGIIFIVVAFYLAFSQYQFAVDEACVFPPDTKLVNVPVGGLTVSEAENRIILVYGQPFIIQTENHQFLLPPEKVGFTIDAKNIVKEAISPCEKLSAGQKFINYVWNIKENYVMSADLAWEVNIETLRTYLQTEINPRYEIPGIPAYPLMGTTEFRQGAKGKFINQALFQDLLIDGFLSPYERSIVLPYQEQEMNGLTPEMLIFQLEHVLTQQNFSGLVELQTERLSDHQIVQFAYNNFEPIDPGVAFTAASTMKIPIMVSSLSRTELPLSELKQGWLNYMVIFSENDPADRLMEDIDPIRGPLIVTEDMQFSLGLENTFIAGYFYLGAPLLDLYKTPANQRTDINLNADLYNQTTAADISHLLRLLYDCEQDGSGLGVAELNGNMSQEKCQLIIDTLKENQIGALIESGLPEGIDIAHKHGWSEERDGLIHTFSDVGIIYGEENDFVLSIFIYSPNQLLFNTANLLTAQLSQVVYNYMNPNAQLAWFNIEY